MAERNSLALKQPGKIENNATEREVGNMVGSEVRYIAERVLLLAEKNESRKRQIKIKISEPKIVEQSMVTFPVDGVVAICHVEIEGLEEQSFDVYGADSLQAVSLAADIEMLIERLSSKYDFYWSSGEPYFDE
ncbi:hypothetical protein [Pseudomonas citronellolis]|uniref:hypothetical protein n=2 Tax=Pseudomonas citronellolis TaxID=53408 RepID=UPI0015A6328D|nr:hypothetical protein [Pseudomonas citronellolis]